MKWFSFLLLLALFPPAHADTILDLSLTPASNVSGLPTVLQIDLSAYQDEGPGVTGEFYENESDSQAQLLLGSDSIWATGASGSYDILYSFYFDSPIGNLWEAASGTTLSFSGSELAADSVGSGFKTVGLSGELTVDQSGSFQSMDLNATDDTPEPSTALLIGSALIGLAVAGRKWRAR